MATKNYDEANQHYNTALSLNPSSDAAVKALQRVDLLLKGKDPDTPDEEQGLEGEDEEEEEEEQEGEDEEDQEMLE